MSEVRFSTLVIEGHVMLRLWGAGAVETMARLSPQDARNLAQELLATADEAEGENARY